MGRCALDPDDRCIVILNFGKDEIENFKLGVNLPGKYQEIVNSNDLKWGGTGTFINDKVIESKYVYEGEEVHGRENYIEAKIPKLSAVILKLKK